MQGAVKRAKSESEAADVDQRNGVEVVVRVGSPEEAEGLGLHLARTLPQDVGRLVLHGEEGAAGAQPGGLEGVTLPGGVELVVEGNLSLPRKLPPTLHALSLRMPVDAEQADQLLVRFNIPKHKALRSLELLPPASHGFGFNLLKQLPASLRRLRVLDGPRIPASGPFPKSLQELELCGCYFDTDSIQAVKGLKNLRKLELEFADGGPAEYPFPTFSIAGLPAGVEELVLRSNEAKMVRVAGPFPAKLKRLSLQGGVQLSPGMLLPPTMQKMEGEEGTWMINQ